MPRALLLSLVVFLICLPSPAQDKVRKSKYDPPTEIPHLESTPPEMRAKIDGKVRVLLDPKAGREALWARAQLVEIGLPAFPRILAALAKVRDNITDVDSDEERLIESGLKLGDEALRKIDGYLDSHSKPVLRPGSSKKYIAYILRLHYKRWLTTLKDLPEAPGPYDPSVEFESEQAHEVHAIGVYHGEREAGKKETVVKVQVRRKGRPLVLVFTAYDPVVWRVEAEEGVDIQFVVLSGYHTQRVTGLPENFPVIKITHEDGDQNYFYCYEKPLDGDEVSEVGRKVQAAFVEFKTKVEKLTVADLTSFRGRYYREAFLIR